MSKDLISRSKLRNDFDEKCYGECCYCTERDNESGECGLVQYAPTVDVVEVVRCKDCRFSAPSYASPKLYRQCSLTIPWRQVAVDFFCAHGAKMDAEVQDG